VETLGFPLFAFLWFVSLCASKANGEKYSPDINKGWGAVAPHVGLRCGISVISPE